ncbi:ferrous iron transport protein A [Thioalkalivibrio sp.]|uniref:FeoA family protein n=1 Tax=Thioalkalivibrio sp. TaxID=2093813 RepID=UPI003976BAC3
MNLRDMYVGQTGIVAGFSQTGRSYRRKLLSMGLLPGTEFRITRIAPMGDPVEIALRGFRLSLRRGEAEAVMVETR